MIEGKRTPEYFENKYRFLLRLRNLDAPKTFTYIPETFKIKWKNPENFIPYRMVRKFNERIFYNFLHRECFNSCLDSWNESECYSNCRNKHLTSLQIFKHSVEENRKWDLLNSFLNLREYQKSPAEMGKNVPHESNYFLKTALENEELIRKEDELKNGIFQLFGDYRNDLPKKVNIFQMYLNGQFPHYTQKAIDRANLKGRYEEYKQLSEKYADRIDDVLSRETGYFNWGHISGDDFVAEDGDE